MGRSCPCICRGLTVVVELMALAVDRLLTSVVLVSHLALQLSVPASPTEVQGTVSTMLTATQ